MAWGHQPINIQTIAIIVTQAYRKSINDATEPDKNIAVTYA